MSDLVDGTRVHFTGNPNFTGTVAGRERRLKTWSGPQVAFEGGQGQVGQWLTMYKVRWDDGGVVGNELYYRGELYTL